MLGTSRQSSDIVRHARMRILRAALWIAAALAAGEAFALAYYLNRWLTLPLI